MVFHDTNFNHEGFDFYRMQSIVGVRIPRPTKAQMVGCDFSHHIEQSAYIHSFSARVKGMGVLHRRCGWFLNLESDVHYDGDHHNE